MVRRRTRPPKIATEKTPRFAGGGNFVAGNAGGTLEDQYFSSPKRKDCKIDNDTAAVVHEGDGEYLAVNKYKPSGKTKGISDRTIGVPLATRSQTRTIENFFKANTAAKNSKLNLISEEKKADTILADMPRSPQSTNNNEEHDTVNVESHLENEASKHPDFIFDLSEDTNDSDDTEFSDEAIAGAHAIDFCTHRAPLRDSHSSRSSTTENIFLQEPVLTLNVDKTLNQASSIKINKTIKIDPIFSSPPSLSAVALNGRFHQVVSLNGPSTFKHDSFCFESKSVEGEINGASGAGDANLMPDKDNDNSSCDSGIAFTSSTDNNNSPPLAHVLACVEEAIMIVQNTNGVIANNSQTRRRKPATPHRIVCPSPIKSAARVVSPVAGITGVSPSGRKITASKEQLSPRKSPRHVVAAASSKTRRRLNTQKEQQTPYHQIGTSESEGNGMQITCKQNGYIDHDTDVINQDQDFEHVEDINFCGISTTTTGFSAANNISSKSILSAKHPTAQENSTNNNNHIQLAKSQTTKAPKPSSINTKTQQPKTNKPLAATNGNRQLTEFFPVRRSVRKTKSAVHREVMQNLQQCVLEERAEGLKIAYFEGKGRGIIADRHFHRNEFVVEYVGDLISVTEASEREKRYTLDENAGCYMYYFKHQNRQYCIDATADTGKLGRLVNHSRKGNLTTNVILVRNRPHLILLANQDIKPGEELTYDYGDRSKLSLQHHPWLAS